jgi:hypothetical protein
MKPISYALLTLIELGPHPPVVYLIDNKEHFSSIEGSRSAPIGTPDDEPFILISQRLSRLLKWGPNSISFHTGNRLRDVLDMGWLQPRSAAAKEREGWQTAQHCRDRAHEGIAAPEHHGRAEGVTTLVIE